MMQLASSRFVKRRLAAMERASTERGHSGAFRRIGNTRGIYLEGYGAYLAAEIAARRSTACQATGYRSRVGIFGLMELNDEIRKKIMANEDASQITEAARRNGMQNLREDGWAKVNAGVTTAEEVMRVTQEF